MLFLLLFNSLLPPGFTKRDREDIQSSNDIRAHLSSHCYEACLLACLLAHCFWHYHSVNVSHVIGLRSWKHVNTWLPTKLSGLKDCCGNVELCNYYQIMRGISSKSRNDIRKWFITIYFFCDDPFALRFEYISQLGNNCLHVECNTTLSLKAWTTWWAYYSFIKQNMKFIVECLLWVSIDCHQRVSKSVVNVLLKCGTEV